MKAIQHILTIMAITVFNYGISQQAVIEKAFEDYDNLAYIKTTQVLLKVANKGYESADLFQKLGNAFYFNNKMEEASHWYGKLMDLNENIDSEYYFRYAQALKYIEKYNESDKWMQKFYESKPNDSRAEAFNASKDYLSKIKDKTNLIGDIKNLDINSPVSDFGTAVYKNQLIIASTRGNGKLYQWNKQPFLNLYAAEKNKDSTYGRITLFSNELSTGYHESTVSFAPGDTLLYFTGNIDKRPRAGVTNRLQIYSAKLQTDGTWGNMKSVHFNSKKYSVAHPSVNKKGTKLYFASDMRGTMGQSDIYVADINKDGTLGKPENLGELINTEGQETFPYINAKGDLYFASNGLPGLGGLDIYVIRNFEKAQTNSQLRDIEIKNLGKPINSAQDDFAYFENLETQEGFFTSNRAGGKGDDDIYTFTTINIKTKIKGVIKDIDTQAILPESTITLYDKEGNKIAETIVGSDAKYSFNIERGEEYLLRVTKPTYSTDEKRLTAKFIESKVNLDISIKKDEQVVNVGDDLSKSLDITVIYFDSNKANIRPDAEIELQKVIQVMQENPAMKIDIRSHTDSHGAESYNKALSAKRNKNTIKYITKKGNIEPERLTGQAYGEEQLINKCKNDVPCTEAEHQLNRRSEFILLSNYTQTK